MRNRIPSDDVEHVLEEQRAKMINVVMRRGSMTRQDAEDLVQDTILLVLEQITSGRFQGKCSVKTYAYSILSRKVLAFLRDRRVYCSLYDIDVEDQSSTGWENGVTAKNRLAECLKRLSKVERFILQEIFWMSKRQKEIAADLGWNEGTLSRRIARILSGLRMCMEER